MPFSEDDLRRALERKDPGPGFTQRVMARIEQEKSKATESKWKQPKRKLLSGLWTFRLRTVLATATALILLVAGGLLGYFQHQRELAREKEAREQAILAVRITTEKLNRVLHRVSQPEAEPKVRRERL